MQPHYTVIWTADDDLNNNKEVIIFWKNKNKFPGLTEKQIFYIPSHFLAVHTIKNELVSTLVSLKIVQILTIV